MRRVELTVAALAIMLAAYPAWSQSPPRKWMPVVLSAGGGIARSGAVGDGGGVGLSDFFSAGVRFHDFVGAGVETRRWIREERNRMDFRFLTMDVYPTYSRRSSGSRVLRLSAGVGKGKIEAHPYVGGHQSSVTRGTTSAWMVGINYDFRVGFVAIAPFINTATARGSGLETTRCSTPDYLSGDFTKVCSTAQAAGSVRMTSFGVSLGIR